MSSSSTAPPESQPLKALQFAKQGQKLSLDRRKSQEEDEQATTAVFARFVTPRDAIIQTADGDRLPSVSVEEAKKLNRLRNEVVKDNDEDEDEDSAEIPPAIDLGESKEDVPDQSPEEGYNQHLDEARPPACTHPLFPPLPLYGPPSVLRNVQCQAFRMISFCLSLSFLGVIVIGSCFSGIPLGLRNTWSRLRGKNPDSLRRFHEEEVNRKNVRQMAAKRWKQRQRRKSKPAGEAEKDDDVEEAAPSSVDDFPPTEGGNDPIVFDVGYYARRVGLDVETFKVQTEDGFILTLWHLYNPREYTPLPDDQRGFRQPDVFYEKHPKMFPSSNCRYPVLLIHGLLQSAGAYCTNDDDSLAFYLCKAGYDVWLGNNRCGFDPDHKTLTYSDPRIWAWNIRHMGVLDLPAFVSRVLYETGFDTLGLICHSQGTTEALVALAKDQRPELGERISVLCALAPAAYAGPLIKKMHFRFMRIISPGAFRLFFGIHAFIPFMMTMHAVLPPRVYGMLGYRVFSYLFDWTDARWDRGLRDRMFQFAPVYVSAESMRWWLGRDGFARQKCILASKEEGRREDEEDQLYENGGHNGHDYRASRAWYGPQAPPFALWIAGSDDLVDGKRLLRRLQNGREPHVRLVHSKIIEEYEHLDVIWAIDMIEQVGREVSDVIWRTVPNEARAICRTPKGL
jgi:pimeloyl-ACP methyl ester carboxylesterase